MRLFSFCLLVILMSIHSFAQITNLKNKFTTVNVDTLISDKISIRALIIDNNKVFYAANENRFGNIDFTTKIKFERKIKNDTLNLEFRSIAQTKSDIFILTAGNPAILYKFSKNSNDKKIVYQENNPKIFYDSMQFYNELDGIAVGDPIEQCLSIITTHDGGNTWQKSTCENAPKIVEGEAIFAASNTNIILKNNKTWIVTGGKKARVFLSNDMGLNFKTIETPIIQGQNMTGIFSADFYDDKTGIIVGGNYDSPNSNFDNKAITKNGGKSWNLVSQNMGFGYASCVQYIPNSNGNELVSVGLNGLFYSNDGALNWTKLSENKNLYTLRFINSNTAIAAGKNTMIKLTFK